MENPDDVYSKLLIKNVRKLPALWNKQSQAIPGIKNHQEILWRGIARNHGCSVEEIKNKWQNLRKCFGRRLKKIPLTQNNEYAINPADFNTDWPHFHRMLFLLDKNDAVVSKKRKMDLSSNTSVKRQRVDSEDESSKESISKRIVSENGNAGSSKEDNDATATEPFSASDSNRNDLGNGGLQIQRVDSSIRIIETSNDDTNGSGVETGNSEEVQVTPNMNFQGFDGDYHFLMSLHQFFQPLSEIQKLDVRTNIYAYLKNTIGSSGNQSSQNFEQNI